MEDQIRNWKRSRLNSRNNLTTAIRTSDEKLGTMICKIVKLERKEKWSSSEIKVCNTTVFVIQWIYNTPQNFYHGPVSYWSESWPIRNQEIKLQTLAERKKMINMKKKAPSIYMQSNYSSPSIDCEWQLWCLCMNTLLCTWL